MPLALALRLGTAPAGATRMWFTRLPRRPMLEEAPSLSPTSFKLVSSSAVGRHHHSQREHIAIKSLTGHDGSQLEGFACK